MVIIKIKKCYGGFKSDYLRKASDYLSDPEKRDHLGGYAVNPYNVDVTYAQMCYIKDYFHKTQDNPLIHFIISFGEEVKSYQKAQSHAVLIGAFFRCRYQLLWAVHKKQRGYSNYHIHMIVNSVSFVDGKLLDVSDKELLDCFLKWVGRVVGDNCRFYCVSDRGSDEI